MENGKFTFVTLSEDQAGRRLDKILKSYCPFLSQGEIEKSLRSKMVRLNMKKARSDIKPEIGDILRYPAFWDKNVKKLPNKKISKELPKDYILYEDKAIMVLNKPSGLAVQGGSGTEHHLDQMLESLPKRNSYRPSSVHRLDRDTSGCLLIAKKRNIAATLGEYFRSRQIDKFYVAVVSGLPDQNAGLIDKAIIKSRLRGPNEICHIADEDQDGAQKAETLFLELDRSEAYRASLMLLKPLTGRTHQLRVHMQSQGHPILGDNKYGSETRDFLSHHNLKKILYLHAIKISFIHPEDNNQVTYNAPLPDYFSEILRKFGFSKAALSDKANYDLLNIDMMKTYF
ncbi:MAG: RluA family pseudouridine synthase [Pseudomonadota bacterium]